MKYNSLLEKKLDEMIQLYDICYSMVLLYNEQGQVIKWNLPAEQFLNGQGELHNLTMMELLPNVYKNYAGHVYVEACNEKVNIRTIMYPQKHTCIPVELKVHSRVICQQKIGICVIQDLSELMENKLEKTEFMNQMGSIVHKRTQFLAQITHDLKTPVNGIYGLAEAMEMQVDNEEDRDSLKLMKDCCIHMRSMIDQVLQHEELRNGGGIKEEYVDFYRVIENVVCIHKMMADEKGLQIYVNISDHIPRLIYSDRSKITEILTNLLTNAVKFTQVGFISLNVMCTGIEGNIITLLFMIGDTGIGIEPERQQSIFEPYNHGTYNMNSSYGGTGLGLAIVKQIVELLKGSLKLISIPGKGSKFFFTIKAKLESDQYTDSLECVQMPDNMEELILKMENTLILDVQKQQYEKVLKVKTAGTKENQIEILHNIENVIRCVTQEKWRKADDFTSTLKLLIPESQKEKREYLLRAELSMRKGAKEKTLEYLNSLQKMI